VTGEPNDVNMFYVLATLMGDGSAAPSQIESKPMSRKAAAAFAETSFDLDGQPSDGWIGLSDPESVFDTPSDLWVHADNGFTAPTPSADESLLPPIPSTLQSSFLELASELFPPDSTFPSLDPEVVFGDFDLMPGTSQTPEVLDRAMMVDLPSFLQDDEFTLIPSSFDIGAVGADLDSILLGRGYANAGEDYLFPAFDDSLVPVSSELTPTNAIFDLASDPDLSIDPSIAAPAPAQTIEPVINPKPATPAAANVGDYQIDTIRVEAKQLDALMGQSGEINVINQQITSRLLDLEDLMTIWENGSRDDRQLQALLAQIPAQSPLHRQLIRNQQQWEQMGALIGKFKKSIGADSSRLDLVTSALESGVKKLRLLPLATIFNLFPRMVRDLAKTQSKEINLAIEGGDLLLDKRLLEEIKDPLMHLLRNAIDHGIETPAERQQNGKLPVATLMIQVRQTGSQTTIEILDDGRGLDIQRIKATAIKRGLHTKAELDVMSVDRIQSLIFAAGFSTRTRVTELSGRGVGLDIVRTNVERIKGSVDVESSPDRGCTFRIVLSHAIGSSQVMMVDVRDHHYAIPVEFVDRMLLVNKAEIFALGGTPTTQINGQTTTVAWLADLLSLPAIAPHSPGEVTRTSNSIACLLLKSGRQQLALLVDRIEDRQLVTIESPHPLLKNVPHLSGSTILGTGEVCLVLNPLDLFTTAAGGNPLASVAVAATTAASIPEDRAPTILLVEDSLVIRTQMTRILSGAGYQVIAANDGLEGWEKLQAGQFDLVVSDVEMPRWGGLELTTQIRNHSDYQDLPVVLVTTLSQAADRDRGLQAGANAYLTKGDFDQQLLLDTLNRLI
jgi:two-component system, chemotaxis family, sensor kinase CheA